MVPIIFQAEDLLADIVKLYEQIKRERDTGSSDPSKLALLEFPENKGV